VSLELRRAEIVAVLGPSGSGKSTLIRALAGLVPHFHGGRFEGRVEVCGEDTRRTRPADLAGRVATVFQDPEDQVVFGRVEDEVAFGLENVRTAPAHIAGRVSAALAAVGSEHLLGRRIAELSAGELQRVCLASALALEPELLILDEPTSQLDPDAAEALLRLASGLGVAVVVSEQRPAGPLEICDRVLFLDQGRILLDAPRDDGLSWLARHRPVYLERPPATPSAPAAGRVVCRLEEVSFAYRGGPPVLEGAGIELRHGEVVALTGPNGSGKTTLAKLAAGLLRPDRGVVELDGHSAYLSQDPGRYLVRDRADEEVALGVDGDVACAREALAEVGLEGFEERHPRDLSSGERERLALASVLVTDPDLLILDEPTRGVDPERKDELARLLRSQATGRATLVVTHDLTFAAEVADRTVSLGVEEPAYV
jgi:energy-coupling factor transport system ATP-binding protein